MLILNKKSITNHENQLFQAELEKFRPHQNRLLQATHKQTALMKELTKSYGDLLQDKRVRAEQAKYETFTRQRTTVLTRYKKVYQAFNDLIAGLMRAQSFYSEMKDTVDSLEQNVETFVNNRRSEGAQLLGQIERDKSSSAGGQADKERDRLRELMERMSVDPSSSSSSSTSPTKHSTSRLTPLSRPSQHSDTHMAKSSPLSASYYSKPTPGSNYPPPAHPSPASAAYQGYPQQPSSSNGNQHGTGVRDSYQTSGGPVHGDPYNPMVYPYQTPVSPPPNQGVYFPASTQQTHVQYNQPGQYLPQGYVPPPPPPGPPPSSLMDYRNLGVPYPAGHGGYAYHQPPRQSGGSSQQGHNDPWAGLNAWK